MLFEAFNNSMQITIEIPDDVAQRLDEEWGSLSHRLLEVFVAQAYGSGALSTSEVRRILQLPSRLETHAFLKRMGVYLNYDEAELERDIQTIQQLRTQ
jgi:predicted HTH domain antitoxin